jgi:hypothetical protein
MGFFLADGAFVVFGARELGKTNKRKIKLKFRVIFGNPKTI